ncbi:MAG: HAMP domain-containing histidine kinase [Bacteroidia bacterium]|nr:HAMP domain-containing histidine kinase [Bacteroidia bacterium]
MQSTEIRHLYRAIRGTGGACGAGQAILLRSLEIESDPEQHHSNSIRYRNGKDPVIKVDVKIKEKRVQLSIEDNGKGIAQEHLSNVYKMFYRATDDGAGSGLGLYIVKEAIDKLNGSINITSKEGHGTTVLLDIPEVA